MKVTLSLIALLGSIPLAHWLSSVVVRIRPGETTEDAFQRIGRWMARVTVVMFATVVVMVLWQTDVVRDTDRAIDLALANGAENCRNQREFQTFIETVLIADVRIATAQYTAAVGSLQQIDEQLAATIPDVSQLSPELQEFVDAAVEQSRVRVQHERERASANVSAIQAELERRQKSLDDARAQRIENCPPVQTVDDLNTTTTETTDD